MANHVHTQIRSAVVAALTGLTTTGSKVYGSRIYDLADANLPGLRVFLDEEAVTPESVHTPVTLGRKAVLVVECCAKANSSLDTTLDTMSKEVETALAAGFTVGSKTLFPVLASSRITLEPGSTPVGVKRLGFYLEFFTLANAPDSLT